MKIPYLNEGSPLTIGRGILGTDEPQQKTSVAAIVSERMRQKYDRLDLSEEGLLLSKVKNLRNADEIEKRYEEKREQMEEMKSLYTATVEQVQGVIAALMERFNEVMGADVQALDPPDLLSDEEIDASIDQVADVLEGLAEDRGNESGAREVAGDLREEDWRGDHIGTLQSLTEAQMILEEEIAELIKELKEMEREMDRLLGLHVEDPWDQDVEEALSVDTPEEGREVDAETGGGEGNA